MQVLLPNRAKISNIVVYPKNWNKPTASLKKPWYIRYRYYDHTGSVKQVTLKKMNRLSSLQDRQTATQDLINKELLDLEAGYNPFTDQFVSAIYPLGSWAASVQAVADSYDLSETSKPDFTWRISQILSAAKSLSLAELPCKSIGRKEIKAILTLSGNTPYAFNKQKAYLKMIYSELLEREEVDANFIKDIKSKRTVYTPKDVLSDQQRDQIHDHLQATYPAFGRYIEIFFHSGCRGTELLRLKREHVDLTGQRIYILVKKRKGQWVWMWKTIKDVALPLWEDLLKEPGEYVFSEGFKPGPRELKRAVTTQNWWKHVKKKLPDITADLYSLKHLHTSEVLDLLDSTDNDQATAEWNSHTSTTMVKTTYDVRRSQRTHQSIKKLNNKFNKR